MRRLASFAKDLAYFLGISVAAAVLALGAIVVFALEYMPEDSRPPLPSTTAPESRMYPDTVPAIRLTLGLDLSDSTAAGGLTEAQRTERLLRATVLVVNAKTSLGSGVMLDNKACLVMTNEHVIDRLGDIEVSYISGFRVDGSAIVESSKAEIVGIPSADNDLALLKLERCNGTSWVPLADSNALRHGDAVVALGNPKGQTWSLTKGVVSQPRRQMSGQTGSSGWEMIQVDAPINSGNSGGPLFSTDGFLLGINSMKRVDTDGIGYARPSNLVAVYLGYLAQDGKMPDTLKLGATVKMLTADEANDAQVPSDYIRDGYFGMLVTDVAGGSLASELGLKAGDVMFALNGDGLYDVHNLRRALYLHGLKADPRVLGIMRDGQRYNVRLP